MNLPIISFIQETREELSKVIWPKKDNVTRLTGQVIIVSLFFAVFAGGLDYLFTSLSQYIFK